MSTKLRRTLFIGLGGTGMNALLHTKKMLYDTYGEIPPMIGFLGIDTDGGVYNKSIPAKDGTPISLAVAEQLPICVTNPTQTYNRTPGKFSWLPEANAGALSALNIGAGQVRSNGRFAITIHEDDVRNRIQTKIGQIKSAAIIDNEKYGLLSNDMEIHMIFSISGGTGCGTFLNMAYLIRDIEPGVKLSGYAVMADVFRAMMQGAAMVRVRPNAFGAIKDLDYLMHLDPVSTPVEIKWLREASKVNDRPFTAFYFIDNQNGNGDIFSNVDQLCEMISLALVTSIGELSVATASVSDNVAKVISDGSMDLVNKKAWAAGFGVSEIVFDGNSLGRIYAQKARLQLINRMLNGGCDDPSQLANNWIDETKIRENLDHDDVIDYFMAPDSPRKLSDLDNPENPKPETEHFTNVIAMEKNETLDRKLEELKLRVATALDDLMLKQIDRECGVFLCENILHAINTQIELCSDEMKGEITKLEEELPRMESKRDTLCKELSDCMGTLFKRGKKQLIEDVCAATMKIARQRREIKRREMAREFYNWLRSEVTDRFERINIITRNLQAVREQSNAAIEQIRQNIGNTSFFQIDLALSEVENVTCQASDIVFDDFVKSMAVDGGLMAIAGMTSAQTAERLLRFVNALPGTKAYDNRTVDDVLNELSDDALVALCGRALQKSLPLFTYNYHGYDADVKSYPADSYYVGVADKKKSRLAKEHMLKNLVPGGSNMDFASTGITDRVIIYRQIGVLPAFTLTALDNYEAEYERFEANKEFTSHWDADLCRRMAKERFSLVPRDEVSEQKALEMWVRGIIYGFITRDTAKDMYQIKSRGLGGQPLTGFKVDMGSSRADAFRFFIENLDVLQPELNAAISKLDIPGPDNTLRKGNAAARKAAEDGTYLAEMSLCPIAIDQITYYPEEFDLINKEINFILERLN